MEPTAVVVADRLAKLLLAVDRGAVVDHRTCCLEGLVVECVEPLNRGEARLDRADPQLGEALGPEGLDGRGPQGLSIEPTPARRGHDGLDQGAPDPLADAGHALLLDQLLRGLPPLCGGGSFGDGRVQ